MNLGDWVLNNLLWISLGLIIFILSIEIFNAYQEDKCCLRHENEIVHQQAWTQWIMSGKIMIPIYHSEGDYDRNVCVQYKPECKD